jgi:DNA polymerase bacteriophage-type
MPFDGVPEKLFKITKSPSLAPRVKVPFASIDFETRSVANLPVTGAHLYFEHPTTDIMCMAWAIGQSKPQLWIPGMPFPQLLAKHIKRGGRMNAWNAMFERLAWPLMVRKYKAPPVRIDQWHCTMVRALACGLPGSLEKAAIALKIPERKDTEGAKAMSKLSKPRRRRDGKLAWWEKTEYPHLYKTMYAYCIQDVVVERAAGDKLPDMPVSEWKQYHFDQEVADRGILIDQELCKAAIKVVKDRQAELKQECVALTGVGPSQPVPLRAWINKELAKVKITPTGRLVIEDLKAVSVDNMLRVKGLPRRVRRALVLRREGGRSSTAKYSAALKRLCRDGTAKGARRFYGAHTGRWSGQGVNFDNLKRVEMKVDAEELATVIKTADANIVESVYGSVLEPVSNGVRSMMVADEGHDLYVADFKSIESRLLAATTGQTSTNDLWLASDLGKGPDVYVVNAAGIFGIPIDKVGKPERYWGKIAELLLGYQGATRPLLAQQLKANIFFRDIYNTVWRIAGNQTREKVDWMWKKIGTKEHDNEKDWKAARCVVEDWRKRNPSTTKFWRMMQQCSVAAVRFQRPTQYMGIRFHYDKHFQMLVITSMSGRNLYYPFARAVEVKDLKGNKVWELRAKYQRDFKGFRGWVEYHPYGGLVTENIIQHQARDAMADRFEALELVGFSLRHTVHDELISQAKRGTPLSLFTETIAVTPSWAPGCPIAVEAWHGRVYKKDG